MSFLKKPFKTRRRFDENKPGFAPRKGVRFFYKALVNIDGFVKNRQILKPAAKGDINLRIAFSYKGVFVI
ncbi:MAG: hypothetical protein CSA23_05455 [Deltaproteobacteria bacterium]|nr:MAG: hypothetical protein CSA23_05455 [Deltaproteobacteria bacterium]